MEKNIRVITTRQAEPNMKPYKEEFEVPYRPNLNIISLLMEIQRNPVNAKGEPTSPVAWEANCLEEVCGACSMLINGRARQACTALVDKLEQPIHLEPMGSFPVLRDLIVDRSDMFETLKKTKAWIPIDGTYDIGAGPRMAEFDRQEAYIYSTCMTCGVCLEACPNYNDKTDYIGPFAMPQVQLKNMHPTGTMNEHERLDALMEKSGISGCGNSGNCTRVCPKGIPIHESIITMNRSTTKRMFKQFLEN